MLAQTIFGFAALAASVSAILVSSPAKDAKVDLSQDNTIVWSSVDTDPTTFTLQLVDQTTNTVLVVAEKVKTSDNKYDLKDFTSPAGSAYKFNFVSNDPLNTGILAQSQTFEVVESEETTVTSATTITSAKATGTATGKDASTTVTSSTTFNTASATKSSSSASASETGANASSTGSSPAASTTANAAASLDKTFALGGGVIAALLMLL